VPLVLTLKSRTVNRVPQFSLAEVERSVSTSTGDEVDPLFRHRKIAPIFISEVARSCYSVQRGSAMATSIWIAKLIGPVLLISAIPMFTSPKAVQALASDFLKSR
jgi:hypothetical protein